MATIATAQQLAIANLYTALFNRAPDAGGLAFWVQALGNGASLATITQSLLTTAEAKAIYPAAQTAEQFVTGFYQSVLGRAPDAAGLAFWTAALNADGGAGSDAAKALLVSQIVTIASTPLPIKPADLSDAQYVQTIADRALFANKIVVGVYYAVELGGTNVEVARQALAVVGSTAASVDAGKLIASGASSSAPVVVGPSLVATAGTDALVGTTANDIITATHLTLGPLDSIDGGAGIDTLNYLDASTVAGTFPVARVTNVEIINVRNVNTVGVGTESANLVVVSDLAAGKTLSIAGLTVTAGASGSASADNVTEAIRTGVDVGNALVSGTLAAGYVTGGVGNSVSFTASTPGDMPDLVLGGTGISAMTVYVDIIQGTNGALDTVTATDFVGATDFNSDRSTIAVAFNGLTAGQAIGVLGDNTVVNANVTGTYAAGVTAATLKLSGGTKGGNVTIDSVSGSALANVTVVSTGLANAMGTLALGATVTSLAIDASTNLSMGVITGAGLRTVTITGAAQAVALGYQTSTVLSSVDASGLTSGSVSVLLGVSTAASFTGGAGNDTVEILGDAVMTGTLDGGAGNDTIVMYSASSLTAGTASRFTHFEALRVSSEANLQAYDTSLFTGINYQIADSSGILSLTKLASGAAVTYLGNASNVTLSLANPGGSDDSLNLTVGNGVASAGPVTNGLSFGAKVAGVETLYLHSAGIAGGTEFNVFYNFSAINTSLAKIVVDGSQSMSLYMETVSRAFTVDATAATGVLVVMGNKVTQVLDIAGGTASDSIEGGRVGGLIKGGRGGDTITLYAGGGADTVAYLNAADSRQDFVNVAGTANATQDAISSFATGTDKIDLKALALDVAIRSLVTKTFASTALLIADEALASFYVAAGTTYGAVAAKIGSDTYLVVDANGDHLFSAATDLVVKLTGVTALAQGDVVYA
jgi:hypothetical protein